MNRERMMQFKTLFEEQRKSLIFNQAVLDESFNLKTEDLLDETDLASSAHEQGMRMRLRNRETLYLKKIDEALRRITEGTFGECESCEEQIEEKRLQVRPTTTHCLSCKEDAERVESAHIDGRKSKSLGTRMRFIAG